MHKLQKMNSLPNKQHGATLFVALVLLILISLIGLGSLKSASVAEKMSANDYQKNVTFQASETAVEVLMNVPTTSPNSVFALIQADPAIPYGANGPVNNLPPINIPRASAQVSYQGLGCTLKADSSVGQVFEATVMVSSTGTITADAQTSSSTKTVQGFAKAIPRC